MLLLQHLQESSDVPPELLQSLCTVISPTLTVSLCVVSFHWMSVVTSSTSALGSPRQRFSRLLLKKGLLLNDISTVGGPPLEG